MSLIERDERVWFIHGPTGWTKFDREPGYAVRATGKIEILGPLVPADQLAGAVGEAEKWKRIAQDRCTCVKTCGDTPEDSGGICKELPRDRGR